MRNGDALTRLVNDVLDVSRIVTGKMRLNLQACDLAAIVREAVETITPAIAARSQHLRIALGDGLILTGDRDRLRQVVWNLLSNAAKFTPAGGTISVRGEGREDSLLLEVADTGSGISAEALPHVFERFWQADSTHTRGHGGLGLGLSLVRHFVELHGGDVTAESEGAGKGARFRIELPRLAVQPKKKAGSKTPPCVNRRLPARALLPDREVRHERIRVVADADAGNAVGRIELARAHDVGLGSTPDRGAVDRAFDLVAAHAQRDFLLHGCFRGALALRRSASVSARPRTACRR